MFIRDYGLIAPCTWGFCFGLSCLSLLGFLARDLVVVVVAPSRIWIRKYNLAHFNTRLLIVDQDFNLVHQQRLKILQVCHMILSVLCSLTDKVQADITVLKNAQDGKRLGAKKCISGGRSFSKIQGTKNQGSRRSYCYWSRRDHDQTIYRSSMLGHDTFLYVGICLRSPRRPELTFPRCIAYQQRNVWWSSSCILWRLLRRAINLLWLDRSSIWLPMGFHLRTLRLWCWRFDVLAFRCQKIVSHLIKYLNWY